MQVLSQSKDFLFLMGKKRVGRGTMLREATSESRPKNRLVLLVTARFSPFSTTRDSYYFRKEENNNARKKVRPLQKSVESLSCRKMKKEINRMEFLSFFFSLFFPF